MNKESSSDLRPNNHDEPVFTRDEMFIANLFRALGMARATDVNHAARQLQMLIKRRKRRRLAFSILAIAATFAMLISVVKWFGDQNESTETIAEQPRVEVPERSQKALLMLSDGSVIPIDTVSPVNLSDAGLVNISIQKGQMLAYTAQQPVQEASATNKIVVPAGGRFKLKLSDGTIVWLNAATSLEYPVVFGSDQRWVELSGEAFFEVVSDNNRPFVVKTNGSSLQVLGTSFNVLAYGEDNFAETTLVSGRLKVQLPNGVTEILLPGQQHKLNLSTLEHTINAVDTKFYTSWRDGIIYFNRMSLKDLAKRLERWYDVEIVFENEQTSALLFSGAVENSRRIDFLLNLIAQASGIEFKVEGKKISIK